LRGGAEQDGYQDEERHEGEGEFRRHAPSPPGRACAAIGGVGSGAGSTPSRVVDVLGPSVAITAGAAS
jgi:hypothetical protein